METIRAQGPSVEARVAAIVGDQLGVDVDKLTPESSLLDDLGADSLDVVELIMALEEEFGLKVPDDDVENIRSVGDVVQYLVARVEAQA
jgi:acyl carrier protein